MRFLFLAPFAATSLRHKDIKTTRIYVPEDAKEVETILVKNHPLLITDVTQLLALSTTNLRYSELNKSVVEERSRLSGKSISLHELIGKVDAE